MKFFHLSDLHIGKQLHGFSLIEDQKYILDQILEMIRERKRSGEWSGSLYYQRKS